MYEEFTVSNFRCFQHLHLADLQRVNLIAGKNNVGKTALLEALFIHCGSFNPELALRVNAWRGLGKMVIETGRPNEAPWSSLFTHFETTSQITLEGEDTQEGHRVISLRHVIDSEELSKLPPTRALGPDTLGQLSPVLALDYRRNGQNATHYLILTEDGALVTPVVPPLSFRAVSLMPRHRSVDDENKRFSELEQQGFESVLLDALRLLEPRLERIALSITYGNTMLHGDIGLEKPRLLPFALMGDGLNRLASLILAISYARDGVVLIDEVENGLHHSIFPKFWQAIAHAARQFNCQIFATTHSWECITAAHRAYAEGGLYDFRLHRLDREGETIVPTTYSKDTLEAAIEVGIEVR